MKLGLRSMPRVSSVVSSSWRAAYSGTLGADDGGPQPPEDPARDERPDHDQGRLRDAQLHGGSMPALVSIHAEEEAFCPEAHPPDRAAHDDQDARTLRHAHRGEGRA